MDGAGLSGCLRVDLLPDRQGLPQELFGFGMLAPAASPPRPSRAGTRHFSGLSG